MDARRTGQGNRGILSDMFTSRLDHKRSPELRQVLNKYSPVETGITTKWFTTIDGLKSAVKQSIEAWIDDRLRARSAGPAAIFAQDADDLTESPRNLVGRKMFLDQLRGLLARGERVLLHGFGGIGKTALAAAAGRMDQVVTGASALVEGRQRKRRSVASGPRTSIRCTTARTTTEPGRCVEGPRYHPQVRRDAGGL